jgi:hypothetical protein
MRNLSCISSIACLANVTAISLKLKNNADGLKKKKVKIPLRGRYGHFGHSLSSSYGVGLSCLSTRWTFCRRDSKNMEKEKRLASQQGFVPFKHSTYINM